MNFLEKLHQLRLEQPRIALNNIDAENSEYCNYAYKNKNSYLIYASDYNEDCLNCYFIYYCTDCADCVFCNHCELCYNCTDCDKCYSNHFCQDCRDCIDLEHCFDCLGCHQCFGSVGLRQKKYHIFNQSHSKEEYEKKIADLRKLDPAEINQRLEELKLKTPRLYMHQLQNEGCTGDYVYQAKNSFFNFDTKKMEDCHYMNNCLDCKDCMDCSNIYHKNELSYECVAGTYLYNCNYCYCCFESNNLEYCEQCFNCHDCFGCVYLKHNKYCIFNEQYSEKDYEKKVAEIKAGMKAQKIYGQQLPSTYPYEDSLAMTYFPPPSSKPEKITT